MMAGKGPEMTDYLKITSSILFFLFGDKEKWVNLRILRNFLQTIKYQVYGNENQTK